MSRVTIVLAAALLQSRHYQVVRHAGPGIARLRVAVVGLEEASPQFKVRDLVPVKAILNVGRRVTDTSPHVLRMSFESEVTDSMSGRLLGEALDGRASHGTVTGSTAPPSPDQFHELIDFWVARFATRLDRGASH